MVTRIVTTFTIILAVAISIAISISNDEVTAFTPNARHYHSTQTRTTRNTIVATKVAMSDYSSNSNNRDDTTSIDYSFMASLKSRMQEVNDRATKLPIIVLDSIVPYQVMNLTIPTDEAALFIDLIKTQIRKETPYFGMLGMSRGGISSGIAATMHNLPQQSSSLSSLSASSLMAPLKRGVQVEIIGKPKTITEDDGSTYLNVLLRGTMKRFQIKEIEKDPVYGWMDARVEYMECPDDEVNAISRTTTNRYGLARTMAKAWIVPELIDQWIKLARKKESCTGQIDQLLQDLGPVPDTEEPTKLSLWVGALINSLPAMEVALDIRPMLLNANTAEERIDIAIEGTQKSIRYMLHGEPLLW